MFLKTKQKYLEKYPNLLHPQNLHSRVSQRDELFVFEMIGRHWIFTNTNIFKDAKIVPRWTIFFGLILSPMAGFQTHISKCSERGVKLNSLILFS